VADISELCGTNGCPKARECAKKLDPDSLNVRMTKFEYSSIYKRFHCIRFEKHYRRNTS
jgi:hypothetical protein